MTMIAVLRHGPTDWNLERRLQGRRDLPLSATGQKALIHRRLPPPYDAWPAQVSPLRRARETAALLGLTDAVVTPGLTEMDWGAYEGRTLADLREAVPGFAAEEARGLDFRPPGGESPREVRARVGLWLAGLRPDQNIVAVTHKGIIRTLLSLAYDWDMTGRAPARLDWSCLHVFAGSGGKLGPYALNLALE